MEKIDKSRYYSFIVAMTIGTLSSPYYAELFGSFMERQSLKEKEVLGIFITCGRSVGCILGGILAIAFGRRKLILAQDLLLIITVVISCFVDNQVWQYAAQIICELSLGCIYIAVLLNTRDIPAYSKTGYSIAFMYAGQMIGYAGSSIVAKINSYYHYHIEKLGTSRTVALLPGLIPIVIQLIFFFTLYTKELPLFLLRRHYNDEAYQSLQKFYVDQDELKSEYDEVKIRSETLETMSETWVSIFSAPHFKNLLLCLLLNCIRVSIGQLTSQSIPFNGKADEEDTYTLAGDLITVLLALTLFIYLDKVSTTFLLKFGFATSIITHILSISALILKLVGIHPEIYIVCIFSLLASSTDPLFLFVPLNVYVIRVLPERAIPFVSLGQFVTICVLAIVGTSSLWVTFWIQMANICLSGLAFFVVSRFFEEGANKWNEGESSKK